MFSSVYLDVKRETARSLRRDKMSYVQ